jgi:hypothetical protein
MKPGGKRRFPSVALRRKPCSARSERRGQVVSLKTVMDCADKFRGLSPALTATRPFPTFQAASGHLAASGSDLHSRSTIGPGVLIREATQAATGTETALAMSFHLSRSVPSGTASVQPAVNPCIFHTRTDSEGGLLRVRPCLGFGRETQP